MEQTKNVIFKILGAYSWSIQDGSKGKVKNDKTRKALNHIIDQLNGRVKSNLKKSQVQIRYNRLRATAGSFVLHGITKRILDSNAMIFDITGFNANVMFELGIAMHAASTNDNAAKVYIICEGKDFDSEKLPSDLVGYFVSIYEIINGRVRFHDSNSLAMSLLSDIADLYAQAYIEHDESNMFVK